jgi:hypothetical protein
MPEMQLLLCTSDRVLQMSEPIPDFVTAAAKVWIAPRHNASICHNCSKSEPCGMDLLNIPELVPHSGAVTTIVWNTLRHNTVICQDCGKSCPCGMDLLNIPTFLS